MDSNAKDIAAGFTRAMTFPEVMLHLDEMLNDGVINTSDFAQVISQDPGLTATLLKFANSPLYGFSGKVSTVDRAVSLIGMREIRDLVLAMAMRTTFGRIPNKIITMDNFWRHSLCCALVSRRVAEVVRHSQRDVLFTAGLLHDIGHLATFSQIPAACTEVLSRGLHNDEVEVFQLERELIGFDHQEVGTEIAKAWRFPEILQDTINFHHVPDEAPRHQFESSVVHVGNTIAVMIELEMDGFSQAPPISSSTLAHIGLDEEQLLRMVPDVQAMYQDMWPVFRLAA